ncbi:hypothetical protein C0075_26025, partial [Rhizobium sp. KAs_5_22]
RRACRSSPYPFLQITEKAVKMGNIELPGIVLFLIFVVVIASICIGFTSLYRVIMLKIINVKLKKKGE